MSSDTVKKLAYTLLKDIIADYNLYEWSFAKQIKCKPEPLPIVIGVDEVLEHSIVRHGEDSAHIHFKVNAAYRLYYSRRAPGDHKARRMESGRIRHGLVVLDVWSSKSEEDDERRSFTIQFLDHKIKVEG